jgi:hypothetical protein
MSGAGWAMLQRWKQHNSDLHRTIAAGLGDARPYRKMMSRSGEVYFIELISKKLFI